MASQGNITISKAEYDAMQHEYAAMQQQVSVLKHELAQLKRMIYGAKSERHVPQDPNQGSLFDVPAQEKEPEKEQVSYTRTKKQAKNKPVRLELPAHLPRKKEVFEPESLPEGALKVSEKITEVLEYVPGTLHVRRIVRPYYAVAGQDESTQMLIADMPTRALPKSNAGEGLLAYLFVSKFVDHLPFYRLVKMLKRQGIEIAESTINGWFNASCRLLGPLYEALKKELLQAGYLMADETPINVLTKDKPGASHKGYHWVYYDPLKKLALFDYQKGRGRDGPDTILQDYRGYLQTDGYTAYDNLKNKAEITQLACMAHARRYFEKAKDNDAARSEYALGQIRKLYAIERQATEQKLKPEEVKALRQQESLPILNEMESWLKEEVYKVAPKTAIGKAISYSLKLWPRLTRYTQDGRLRIDNNLVENSIRPVALGRKNYLFAGSHNAAQHAAMIYSFFASCKIQNVEPFEWLKETLKKIPDHPANKLYQLLPGQY